MNLAEIHKTVLKEEDMAVYRKCAACVWYSKLDDTNKAFFDQLAVDAVDNTKSLATLRRTVELAGMPAKQTTFDKHVRMHHKVVVNGALKAILDKDRDIDINRNDVTPYIGDFDDDIDCDSNNNVLAGVL